MIVIAIIGILAAVAIPNYISFRDKAYCSGAESDANSVLGTLADYYAIPAHTGSFSGTNISSSGGDISGATFKALSNANTATLTGATDETVVTVRDTSNRCPTDYKTSQALAGWSSQLSTFTKSM
jgi:Tfp pilus assembly protein PilE